jgi:phenylpropionate dioxygenase-like ring-hydroxylating dioxygenase large terminal subunit
MPCGWFQIGWSCDFPARTATRISCLGREFVAYRGESGDLHVLDAFCRHMGAHLGVGGSVEGEAIRCPFHGWVFGPDGRNTEIPYSSPDLMNNVRLGCWQVREIDEVVLIYFSADGSPPPCEPGQFRPRHMETWPVHETTTKAWLGMTMAPQMAGENVVDAAHLKFVHRNASMGELTVLEEQGPVFRTQVDSKQGDANQGGAGPGATWATPNGPVDARMVLEARGLGLYWNIQYGFDEITSMLAATPTSPDTTDIRATIWIPRTRGDGSPMDEKIRDRWVRFMHHQIESDMIIWNHQTYVERPPLAKSESGPMRSFRKWSRQFYPSP